MKSRIIKTVQILFLSLLVSASIFPFLGSVASAKIEVCKTRDECGTEVSSATNNRIYNFIPGPNTPAIPGDLVNSAASSCEIEGTGRCVANTSVRLNVKIPRIGGGMIDDVKNIDEYINAMFGWLLRLGGVIAAVVMVWGGYIYITAAGNQARIGQAKEIITGGLIGLVLLFGSVTLLGFLNERLLVAAPIYVDIVSSLPANFGFCETETPTPLGATPTCGKQAEDSNGGPCLSDYCGTSNAVCVPNILKIGLGVSGEQLGYACIDNNSEALIDACEDSPLQHCAYLSQKISFSYPTTATRCGIGPKLCKPGLRITCPNGFPEVSSISKCGSKSGILGPVAGMVINGTNSIPGRYFIEDSNEEELYMIYFRDYIKPPKGANMNIFYFQTAWKEEENNGFLGWFGDDLIRLGGVCCNGNILVVDHFN